ncbi:MAG: sterol desaturase family protein [Terriglobales bacterium]
MSAEERACAALARGQRLKQNNAITSLACGALPGLLIACFIHPSAIAWMVGISIGMLWANAFEYFYHRYLLHLPRSSFGREHLLHHSTLGRPEEPEHVTFGSSPFYLMILFATNGAIALAINWLLHVRSAPGILTGFSIYFVMVEEIHWRIHMGEWLPWMMEPVREYHMAHHDIPDGRFNVFFPVFDYIFGNMRPEIERTEARTMAETAVRSNRRVDRLSSLEAALLWTWMIVVAVCIRHLWSGPKT